MQPQRVQRFKICNDPYLKEKVRKEKVRDVVGLYLNPPDRALILCADEKGRVLASDRVAPISPLRPGLLERQTHDRNDMG